MVRQMTTATGDRIAGQLQQGGTPGLLSRHRSTALAIVVLVALVVGTIEVFSIFADLLNLSGGFWDYVGNLDFGVLGGIIIGIFVLSWVFSTLLYRIKKYDNIEVRVENDRPEIAGVGES